MANKNTRKRESKKPKKGADKAIVSPVVATPQVKVISKSKPVKEPKE